MNPLLIAALISVESSGDNLAFNRREHALGPLQIRPALIADVNRRTGTHYEWRQMTNRSESIKVFSAYCKLYSANTDESCARLWNSGPAYRQKTHLTESYWRKVRSAMNRLSITKN